ncbi:hypothetical protein THAOC_24879, partial [Thalassiosira oceanica]
VWGSAESERMTEGLEDMKSGLSSPTNNEQPPGDGDGGGDDAFTTFIRYLESEVPQPGSIDGQKAEVPEHATANITVSRNTSKRQSLQCIQPANEEPPGDGDQAAFLEFTRYLESDGHQTDSLDGQKTGAPEHAPVDTTVPRNTPKRPSLQCIQSAATSFSFEGISVTVKKRERGRNLASGRVTEASNLTGVPSQGAYLRNTATFYLSMTSRGHTLHASKCSPSQQNCSGTSRRKTLIKRFPQPSNPWALQTQARRNARVYQGASEAIEFGRSSRTTVLFLDEVTSGLDSAASFQVVQVLHRIAKARDIMIVVTIHQPSTAVLEIFDDLLLLSKGKVAYAGRLKKAEAHFESLSAQGHDTKTLAAHCKGSHPLCGAMCSNVSHKLRIQLGILEFKSLQLCVCASFEPFCTDMHNKGIPMFVIQRFPGSAFIETVLQWSLIMYLFESVAECSAAWAPNSIIGMLGYLTYWILSFLFGGIFLPPEDIYWPLKAAYYALPFNYYTRSMVNVVIPKMEYKPCNPSEEMSVICVESGNGDDVAEAITNLFPVTKQPALVRDALVLFGMIVFMKLLYIVGVVWKNQRVQKMDTKPCVAHKA